ncbi:MAG: hypothetical protein ACI9O4_000503 [Chitinophagales bacterium]|jgi:hypothetical protein
MYRLIAMLCFSLVALSTRAQTFTDVMSSSGINTTNSTLDNWGSGISFYDFNQDGWDDLSFAKVQAAQGIFVNNQGTFQVSSINIFNTEETKIFLWVDYDNDGHLDIFITSKNGSNHLYRNDGNFVFTEVTNSTGLYTGVADNYGAAFGDYDKDGFLDLYVCRYDLGSGPTSNLIYVNNLYHNNGDGTFTDVTFSAGVADSLTQSFQAVWFDYNNDTWPDLYVVNDKRFDGTLFHNNGDGTFTDVTVVANLDLPFSNLMTGSVADFNNDQYLDLFVTNIASGSFEAPRLYENQGNDTFINVYNQFIGDIHNTTWGGLWVDVDNNTKQDLYVATDFLSPSAPAVESYFYRNNYPISFSKDSLIFIGNHKASSHAVARGDFDRNGFYDIAVYNEAPEASFLWQNSGTTNHYIRITLEGTVSNSFAIGSWIRVFVNGQQFSQYTMCGENYLGQNSQHHIFGLGLANLVDSVHVEYLSGIIDKYYNLNVNQEYYFTEGESHATFELTLIGTNPICRGDSLELIAPDFVQYLWSTGDTTQAILVFENDTFSVQVVDSFGNQIQSSLVVTEVIDAPAVSYSFTEVSCYEEADGEIHLEFLNQGLIYHVTWSNGQFGDTLSGVGAGVYTYIYQDEFACVWLDSMSLDEPSPLNLQVSTSPQTTSQLGSLTYLPNGGVTPYSVLLGVDTINGVADSLVSGPYQLSLIDNNGCVLIENINIFFEEDSLVSGLSSRISSIEYEIYNNCRNGELEIYVESDNADKVNCYINTAVGQLIHLNNKQIKKENNLILVNYSTLELKGLYFILLTTEFKRASFPFFVD